MLEENNHSEEDVRVVEKRTMSKSVFWTLIGLAVLAVGALFWSYSSSLVTPHVPDTIGDSFLQPAFENRKNNTVNDEIAYLQQELQSDQYSIEQQRRINVRLAQAYFALGDETSKAQAVSELLSLYQDPFVSDQEKSNIISNLMGFYYHSRDAVTFEQIFVDSPLSFLYEEGEAPGVTMRKLAEHAISLHPIARHYAREAIWYSGELLDNPNLTIAERVATEQKLLEILEAGQSVRDAELVIESQLAAQGVRYVPSFEHFKAFHLASVVWSQTIYPEEVEGRNVIDPQLFEDEWQGVFAKRTERPGDINLDRFTTWGYFYYSAFLYDIYGVERIDDINANLAELKAIADANPELIRDNGVLYLLRIEGQKPEAERDHTYFFAVDMATLNEDFAELLRSVGWEI